MNKKNHFMLTLLAGLIGSVSAATVDLRILETTDLHSNMMDFNYYKNEKTEHFGLVRTASLIAVARKEAINTILVDNGDLIQGSPLADYMASGALQKEGIHAVYKAMNTLDYTVGNIGNHEFNYGLSYLKLALAGANFPYINANVYDSKTGQPYFQQYIIKNTAVKDRQGKQHFIKIGYIGFVPPQIMQWDRANLKDKVIAKDITEMAKELVPKMRKEGAELVIAIAHSGISTEPHHVLAENSVYYLSQVPGIDAIAFGHSHALFPDKSFAGVPGIDIDQGTINGVPAVMAGSWGDHLGVIDFVLQGKTGDWKVKSSKVEVRPIYDSQQKKALVKADKKLVELLAEDHQKTIDFMQRSVGKLSAGLYSYLALIQDDAALQIVRNAQRAYVQHFIQGDPDLEGLPVLSAAAPFKAGGRKNNPTEYIEIPPGELTFRNIADIYIYPNTLVIVKATGAEIKEWLECSAGMFNQIDVNKIQPQYLFNWEGFRAYNFDMFDELSYQINVTQPARYDGNCNLLNPAANRIENLLWKGDKIADKQFFLVAVNNYRAYTGAFPGTGEDKVVFAAPDEVRTIVASYITKITKEKGEIVPKVYNTWRLAPITSKQPLDIRIETSPSKQAKQFIQQNALYPMTHIGMDSVGFGLYRIQLDRR